MKNVFLWALAGCLTLAAAQQLASCRFDADPPPDSFFVQFRPSKICTGETLYVSYWVEHEYDVDFVELLARDGTSLMRLDWPVKYGYIESFSADWLPLRYRVRVDGRIHERTSEDYPGDRSVTSLDEPVWVTYDSFEELRGTVELRPSADVGWDYDVYAEFLGFWWKVPASDFGQRAFLTDLRNSAGRRMRFETEYNSIELEPGEEAALGQVIRPWVSIFGHLAQPTWVRIGRQNGEETKPPNADYEFEDLYHERILPLDYRVVCLDEPPQ